MSVAMAKRSYALVKIFQIIWKINVHLPFALCRQRPMAGRREDERRGDHEDTGRISRFCKGHNRGSPLRRCDRCRRAYSPAGTPWPRSIASCLSVVPDCELPVGPSSDDRTLCRRRNIKPERRIIDLRIYIRNIRERGERHIQSRIDIYNIECLWEEAIKNINNIILEIYLFINLIIKYMHNYFRCVAKIFSVTFSSASNIRSNLHKSDISANLNLSVIINLKNISFFTDRKIRE